MTRSISNVLMVIAPSELGNSAMLLMLLLLAVIVGRVHRRPQPAC